MMTYHDKLIIALHVAMRLRVLCLEVQEEMRKMHLNVIGFCPKKAETLMRIYDNSAALFTRIENDPVKAYDEGLAS